MAKKNKYEINNQIEFKSKPTIQKQKVMKATYTDRRKRDLSARKNLWKTQGSTTKRIIWTTP